MDCCDPSHHHAHDRHDPWHRQWHLTPWMVASVVVVLACYLALAPAVQSLLGNLAKESLFLTFTHGVVDQLQQMALGLGFGVISIAVLNTIPRHWIAKALGTGNTVNGIFRAVLAGLVFDLCNHGILLIGMKLYKKGASIGQVMAFLISSPWNSLSLTLILWAMVGLKWLTVFIVGSVIIAVITGLIFDALVTRGILPENPYQSGSKDLYEGVWPEAPADDVLEKPRPFGLHSLITALQESIPILQWILLGVILAALLRCIFPTDDFQAWFGPTLAGLGFTLLGATIMEVCSEGSVPIATDLLLRANAPGNSFAFLMAGASTDYTEVAALKQTTGSWKIALFLPLITVPQVLIIAYLVNSYFH